MHKEAQKVEKILPGTENAKVAAEAAYKADDRQELEEDIEQNKATALLGTVDVLLAWFWTFC